MDGEQQRLGRYTACTYAHLCTLGCTSTQWKKYAVHCTLCLDSDMQPQEMGGLLVLDAKVWLWI